MYKIIKGINLVYGEAATGKTTLAVQEALKEAKENKKIAFIDTENSFSNISVYNTHSFTSWVCNIFKRKNIALFIIAVKVSKNFI